MKSIAKKLVAFALVALFIGNALLLNYLVEFGSGSSTVLASSQLTLKWRVRPNNTITIIGPQAAKLVPGRLGMQIVVAGGSTLQDGEESEATAHGAITVLDGTNGSVIWSATGFPIGIHQPFEIADLNNDGNLEILTSAWSTTLALNGQNGSIFWRSSAPSDDLAIAIADVNGDGFPEIFVNSGGGPYKGYDWITMLDHEGNILRQAFSWHPCFGGLSIADPSFDGNFKIFQGDRSPSYSGRTDGYKGGGRSVRALDALTLEPLWNDHTILSSSHIPILADVNKDGILDVIVGDQGSRGIAVLNAEDGSVVTSPNGKYRYGGTGMPVHSQPTVYDIDGDGNLELIDNTYSQPLIWDLYEWKLDGALIDENGNPLFAAEPPKIGNVTGGQGMNIIAVPDSSPQNPYPNQMNSIYIYDSNYQLVQKITGSGLDDPRSFTLVQDVDGDGLNELVLTSGSGNIYVFDTSVPTPNPGITSTSQFYGGYRRGVAEYVAPPMPNKPVLSREQPQDSSLNQMINPTLSVQAADFQGSLMNITFSTNNTGIWTNIQSYQNVSNGTYTALPTGMDKNRTAYYWNVTATDSNNKTNSKIYKFTTYPNTIDQGVPFLVSNGGNVTGENLVAHPNGSDTVNQTNIYSWYKNGSSLANLILPFDTQTTNTPSISDEIFIDGFENSFQKWDGNGLTNWNLDSAQKQQGAISAHAALGDSFLTSDDIDTSSADGITVSFWYFDQGTGFDDNVYLQFWNGQNYANIFKLGNTKKNSWHLYTVQTYDSRNLIKNFRIRFDASSIDPGRNVWIDEVTVKAPTRTKDYSGYGNHGTVHSTTWTSQGVVGGAYNFDGMIDFISINDNPSLGGNGSWPEIALEFWIKPTAQLRGATIITKRVAGQSIGSYTIGFLSNLTAPANTLFWGLNSTFDNAWHEISNTSTTVLEAGSWHHVVATYKSGQGLSIYINGTIRATSETPFTGNIAPSRGVSVFNQPVFIGFDGKSSWFSGTLDEIRIYPKSMSGLQVFQRYTETLQGLSNSSTIAGQDTNVGDVWKCQVTPNNGFGDGISKFTNNLTVLPNPIPYQLVVGVSGNGSTNPSVGSYNYTAGSNVSVAAIPDSGWQLSYWLLNGSNVGSTNPYNFTINSNYNLTAVFNNISTVQWTLTVNSAHDSPNPSVGATSYVDGQLVTSSVTSPVTENNTIWNCTGYMGTGSVPNGTGISVTFTISQNSTITWNWQGTPVQYQLVVGVSGNGTTNATGTILYDAGTVVYVNATASADWNFSYWLLDGSSAGSANPFSVTMNANHTLTAVFTPVSVPPQFSSDFETGSFSEWNGTSVTSGETATVVSTLPRNGSFSARFTTDGQPSFARAYSYKNIAGTSEVYALAYVYFNGSASLGNVWNTLWLVQFRDSGSSSLASFGVARDQTSTKWACSFGSQTAYATSGPVAGTWYSVEAYFNKTASGKALIVYVDGTEVASLIVNTSGANNVAQVRLGIAYNDPGYTFNLYVDTAIIDNKYIQPPSQSVQWKLSVASAHDSPIPSGGDTSYNDGSSVTANVTSPVTENDTVWTCTGWSGTGSVPSTGFSSSVTFTISQNSTITWNWQGTPVQYQLVVGVSGNGSTNPSVGSYNYTAGTLVSVNATAGSDSAFSYWLLDGSASGSVNPFTVTMNANHTLTAVFTSGYLFSSDFETGSFSEWNGTSVTGGETATVVSTLPRNGSFSARFTTDGQPSFARAYSYKNIADASEVYSLAYVYFDGGLPLATWNSLWLMQFRDSGGSVIASFGIMADQTSTKWACTYGGQTAFATSGPVADTWYSVEAYFNKTTTGKALIIYVNGQEVASLTVNTSGANNVSQIRLGIAYNDPGYAFTLYVDTAIIDNKYIQPPF